MEGSWTPAGLLRRSASPPGPCAGTDTTTQLPCIVAPQNSPSLSSHPGQDMRKHVIMTLLDTEQSYVESLRTLMQVWAYIMG